MLENAASLFDTPEDIQKKIMAARSLQRARFAKNKILTNSEMSSKLTDKVINLDETGEQFIREVMEKQMLSARGYYRVLKVARTIADLAGSENVNADHLAEAFGYRLKTSEA